MKKQISISIEEYNVLRGTFKKAVEIIDSLGVQFGSETSPKKTPKETKQQKVKNYMSMIETGQRAKKPEYLKKNNRR